MIADRVSKARRLVVWERDSYTCHYCKSECVRHHRLLRPTVDHKTPISRGGDHEFENLVTACFQCNSIKRDKTEIEYIDWLLDRCDCEETRL